MRSEVSGRASPEGPARPRMIQALSVEETKPRLMYDARPPNNVCGKVAFSMDTVARVALVASEGCFHGSPGDSSGFHHVLLHSVSWSLFGLRYQGVEYVWTVLPFGWCESPCVYHTLSEAKVEFLRLKGIPALAYIEDSWLAEHAWTTRAGAMVGRGGSDPRSKAVVMVMPELPFQKEVRPAPYEGAVIPGNTMRFRNGDSETASFWLPQHKMDKLQHLLRTAFEAGGLSFRTLERMAGKCMSMTVAIRPGSLWTHAMFTVLSRLEKSGMRHIDLSQDECVDLRGELKQWLGILSSSTAWVGVVNAVTGPFRAGGGVP